jgi:hypothetical protein
VCVCCVCALSPSPSPQVFTGDYFGPPGVPLPIVATGRQANPGAGGGTGATVRTSNCTVVGAGHTTVHCASPAGVGAGYVWTLVVADQATAASGQTTAYGPPAVGAVAVAGVGVAGDEPGAVPTAGGATMTLTGVNFGADNTRVAVAWNGAVLSGVAITVPHTALSFVTPPGEGAAATVTLTVGGHRDPVPLSVPFAAPRVTGLNLDMSRDSDAFMDCSEVGGDGRPAADLGFEQRAIVVVRGANFGARNGTEVTIGGVVCVLLAPASHGVLVCRTPMCIGAACVSVAFGCGLLRTPRVRVPWHGWVLDWEVGLVSASNHLF